MRRCEACGRFFDADECPGDHSHIAGYEPPRTEAQPQSGRIGMWLTYKLDDEPCPAMIISEDPPRIVVYGPGLNGHVGVYDLEETI